MSIHSSPVILVYCCVLAGIIGAVFGSFLNCAAWRIAHGESFLKGRSHCPACGHALGVADLVPIFSWLFLKGKCHYCGEKISTRYPLTEAFFAVVSILCLLRFDLTVLCLRNWIFLCCLFLLSLVDLECKIIPDGCHIVSLVAWIAALPFLGMGWKEIGLSVLCGAVYGGGILLVSLVLDRVLGRESLGGGDIKLFAVAGLYLGWIGTLFAMIFACVLGLVFAFAYQRGGGEERKQFPFGPAIAAACALILLYGEPLVSWYMALL